MNKSFRLLSVLCAGAFLVLTQVRAEETVFISEDFSGGGPIIGHRAAGELELSWNASDQFHMADGMLLQTSKGNKSAVLDLGLGFLSQSPGIYRMKTTVKWVKSDEKQFLSVGFADGANVETNHNPPGSVWGGQPFLLIDGIGDAYLYAGRGRTEPVASLQGIDFGSPLALQLQIDTRGRKWAISAKIGQDSLVDSAGKSEFPMEPALKSRYVGITVSWGLPTTVAIDKTELTFEE